MKTKLEKQLNLKISSREQFQAGTSKEMAGTAPALERQNTPVQKAMKAVVPRVLPSLLSTGTRDLMEQLTPAKTSLVQKQLV